MINYVRKLTSSKNAKTKPKTKDDNSCQASKNSSVTVVNHYNIIIPPASQVKINPRNVVTRQIYNLIQGSMFLIRPGINPVSPVTCDVIKEMDGCFFMFDTEFDELVYCFQQMLPWLEDDANKMKIQEYTIQQFIKLVNDTYLHSHEGTLEPKTRITVISVSEMLVTDIINFANEREVSNPLLAPFNELTQEYANSPTYGIRRRAEQLSIDGGVSKVQPYHSQQSTDQPRVQLAIIGCTNQLKAVTKNSHLQANFQPFDEDGCKIDAKSQSFPMCNTAICNEKRKDMTVEKWLKQVNTKTYSDTNGFDQTWVECAMCNADITNNSMFRLCKNRDCPSLKLKCSEVKEPIIQSTSRGNSESVVCEHCGSSDSFFQACDYTNRNDEGSHGDQCQRSAEPLSCRAASNIAHTSMSQSNKRDRKHSIERKNKDTEQVTQGDIKEALNQFIVLMFDEDEDSEQVKNSYFNTIHDNITDSLIKINEAAKSSTTWQSLMKYINDLHKPKALQFISLAYFKYYIHINDHPSANTSVKHLPRLRTNRIQRITDKIERLQQSPSMQEVHKTGLFAFCKDVMNSGTFNTTQSTCKRSYEESLNDETSEDLTEDQSSEVTKLQKQFKQKLKDWNWALEILRSENPNSPELQSLTEFYQCKEDSHSTLLRLLCVRLFRNTEAIETVINEAIQGRWLYSSALSNESLAYQDRKNIYDAMMIRELYLQEKMNSTSDVASVSSDNKSARHESNSSPGPHRRERLCDEVVNDHFFNYMSEILDLQEQQKSWLHKTLKDLAKDITQKCT